MKQYYRNAVEQGGDQISSALGFVEKHLMREPNDIRALAYKGSLLIMLGAGQNSAKKAIYIESGLGILNAIDPSIDLQMPYYAEVLFVVVTTKVKLASDHELGEIDPMRVEQLTKALDFNALSSFEIVYGLVVAAKYVAENGDKPKARGLIQRARSIDAALVLKIKRQIKS